MRRPEKDPICEDRIHEEAIVDAYGSEEKAMSWYYYLAASAPKRLLHFGKERPSK